VGRAECAVSAAKLRGCPVSAKFWPSACNDDFPAWNSEINAHVVTLPCAMVVVWRLDKLAIRDAFDAARRKLQALRRVFRRVA
jgi:hypothetical protein